MGISMAYAKHLLSPRSLAAGAYATPLCRRGSGESGGILVRKGLGSSHLVPPEAPHTFPFVDSGPYPLL